MPVENDPRVLYTRIHICISFSRQRKQFECLLRPPEKETAVTKVEARGGEIVTGDNTRRFESGNVNRWLPLINKTRFRHRSANHRFSKETCKLLYNTPLKSIDDFDPLQTYRSLETPPAKSKGACIHFKVGKLFTLVIVQLRVRQIKGSERRVRNSRRNSLLEWVDGWLSPEVYESNVTDVSLNAYPVCRDVTLCRLHHNT